jgi:hypothetical protein
MKLATRLEHYEPRAISKSGSISVLKERPVCFQSRASTIRQSNYAILTNFCIFPRYIAPDFLQYLSEDPNQRERGRGTMKWLQLAYSIISVNAVILALLAVIMNQLGRARSRNDN